MVRWVALFALLGLLFLSGCRIGIGVGVEVRSLDAALSGPFFLDGREVGYLPPLGLDFPHEVKVFAPACPSGTCVFRVAPPLRPGEVIPLSLPR